MTRTTPFRLMILHLIHIFLTDGLTFIIQKASICSKIMLFQTAVNYPSPCEIIRRNLHHHLITRDHLNEIHPHFAGDMSQNPVPILEFHPEHGIGQSFNHNAFHFNPILLAHIIYSTQRYMVVSPGLKTSLGKYPFLITRHLGIRLCTTQRLSGLPQTFFHKTFVVPRQHMRLDLVCGIHSHTNHNQ